MIKSDVYDVKTNLFKSNLALRLFSINKKETNENNQEVLLIFVIVLFTTMQDIKILGMYCPVFFLIHSEMCNFG